MCRTLTKGPHVLHNSSVPCRPFDKLGARRAYIVYGPRPEHTSRLLETYGAYPRRPQHGLGCMSGMLHDAWGGAESWRDITCDFFCVGLQQLCQRGERTTFRPIQKKSLRNIVAHVCKQTHLGHGYSLYETSMATPS